MNRIIEMFNNASIVDNEITNLTGVSSLYRISQTDYLLVHLQSFTSSSTYYNVPEIIKKGMPLFYLPSNSNTPQVNQQLQSSK